MPLPRLWLADDAPDLEAGLDRIREEFDVPGPHGPEAVAEAERTSSSVLGGLEAAVTAGERRDARDVPFVTIDPAGSRDLDQALHIERRAKGWRVRYAIADVPAFVADGGPLAAEVQERGVTFYLPDHRSPLHPPLMAEGTASLLPDQDRAAVLWTIDLDADGSVASSHLERCVVRSRAQLTYAGVQTDIDSGRADADGTLALLAEVGRVRSEVEAARDGVSLDLPAQRIVLDGDRYHLEREATVPAMGWNAQISLLTGMVAADAMLSAGAGLLRTLPPPDREVIKDVKRTAKALGVPWPDGASYASVVRGLDSADPDQAALLALAARGLRGAGYLALVPGQALPDDPAAVRHAAVAAPYAHVTAPLRRLCDRAAIEVCLALFGDREVPAPVLAALPELPRAGAREGGAARAAVDLVEALLLRSHVGEVVSATVVSATEDRSVIAVTDLAVQGAVAGPGLPLGETVQVRIEGVDLQSRRVTFRSI